MNGVPNQAHIEPLNDQRFDGLAPADLAAADHQSFVVSGVQFSSRAQTSVFLRRCPAAAGMER